MPDLFRLAGFASPVPTVPAATLVTSVPDGDLAAARGHVETLISRVNRHVLVLDALRDRATADEPVPVSLAEKVDAARKRLAMERLVVDRAATLATLDTAVRFHAALARRSG